MICHSINSNLYSNGYGIKRNFSSKQSNSLNYKHNPTFGLNNPQAALYRAQNLKSIYAKSDLKYLLPNEVWSNKRIFTTIDTIGKKIDKFIYTKDFTVDNFRRVIFKSLPQKVSKDIDVRDFNDYKRFLNTSGYDKKTIKLYTEDVAGVCRHFINDKKAIIYVNIDKAKESKFDAINLKATFEHELKHALTSRCTNIKESAFLGLMPYRTQNSHAVTEAGYIFRDFEDIFRIKDVDGYTELTKENMLKNLVNTKTNEKYSDIKQLHNAMADAMSDLLNENEEFSSINYNFDRGALWQTLSRKAMDEKEAYRTEKCFRELSADKNKPIVAELQSLVYAEMEKFFKNASLRYKTKNNKPAQYVVNSKKEFNLKN